jgi:hypothetical protein
MTPLVHDCRWLHIVMEPGVVFGQEQLILGLLDSIGIDHGAILFGV